MHNMLPHPSNMKSSDKELQMIFLLHLKSFMNSLMELVECGAEF